jgi:hypothetical protein
MRSKFLILMSLVIFTTCNKPAEPSVDTALLPYFNKFQVEGAKRGVSFDYNTDKISGAILKFKTNDIIGQCVHSESDPSTVRINISFWNKATDFEKEFYVFHELGHCFLKREHISTADSRGFCNSIMHSNPGICKFIYNDSTRATYIDELFSN